MVGAVCTCITQCASGKVARMAPWKVEPAGLIGQSLWPMVRPCTFTFTRLNAVTSL